MDAYSFQKQGGEDGGDLLDKGGWRRFSTIDQGNGESLKCIFVSCPDCGRGIPLEHEITAEGLVSPTIDCPNCPFDEVGQLERFTAADARWADCLAPDGAVPPKPKPKVEPVASVVDEAAFGPKIAKLLDRYRMDFEQLHAMPDDALLGLKGVGQGLLREIRAFNLEASNGQEAEEAPAATAPEAPSAAPPRRPSGGVSFDLEPGRPAR